ncbi:MAG: epoxyqueuosine reductase QueH [Bacillota bacterium]|jgi:predicted adenine nucleotide alpha hydrolase (AANH) superfamily ATPase
MNVLVHMCCGPCASYPVPLLLEQGHQVRGLYYNPNIHPYQEYQRRQEGVKQLAQCLGVEVIYLPEYDIEKYFRETAFREGQRCRLCYYLRLKRTAQVAKKGNFAAFTTTLLVSPFQKHEVIREVAERISEEVGVPFYYQDFRPGYRESVIRSKEMGLYRQQYCGCVFSERERFMSRSELKRSQQSLEERGKTDGRS